MSDADEESHRMATQSGRNNAGALSSSSSTAPTTLSVVGMFRVGSETVLATTLNVVGAVEEEEDKAPALFLPL